MDIESNFIPTKVHFSCNEKKIETILLQPSKRASLLHLSLSFRLPSVPNVARKPERREEDETRTRAHRAGVTRAAALRKRGYPLWRGGTTGTVIALERCDHPLRLWSMTNLKTP